MNFFNAKLVRSNGGLTVDAGEFHVPVPQDRLPVYEKYEGKDIIMGIRPEDIHDPNFTPPNIKPADVETNVEVTELMGNEIYLHMKTGNDLFVGRVDPRTTAVMGAPFKVVFNMDNMHLFEVEGNQVAIR